MALSGTGRRPERDTAQGQPCSHEDIANNADAAQMILG